ncbi:MAG: aminodeoxychorismate/anthranilate synthase component II [Clostridiales bacterium]|jgi:anthranilate synthase component 2|nr:aminodeoxychorismate/anthranilate synthase component II [Clostridiales bacterium]
MILLIDNYDSFSYNLYQLVGAVDEDIKVIRNDVYSVSDIAAMKPDYIILSPGPGRPENAGVCIDIVKSFAGKTPILGVCLGHQAICEAFGSPVIYSKQQMHGKQSDIEIDNGSPLFKGLPSVIKGARYHSLAADPARVSDSLKITGMTADGEIMAVNHKQYEIYGVQFHPESILTPDGVVIIKNFLKR